jgi:hypothetical protein
MAHKALSIESEPIILAGEKIRFESVASKVLEFSMEQINGKLIERQLSKHDRELTSLLKIVEFAFDDFNLLP